MGLQEVLGVQITVAVSAMPQAPVAGQTVQVGAKQARIERVITDDLTYELVCTTKTK